MEKDEARNPGDNLGRRLGDVLAALQQEIAGAIQKQQAMPPGVELKADRVVLTLQVEVSAGEDGAWQVAVPTTPRPGTHTIAVEFSVRRDDTPRRGVVVNSEQIVNALMEVFGVPSFDSSARATVFRETFAPLPEPQVKTLVNSLRVGLSEGEAPLKLAHQMLARLLEKGPAGLPRSAEVLEDLFRQHSAAMLLKIIEETWKTPEDWAG